MRILHFETLRPICPACRTPDNQSRLNLARVEKGDDELVVEGALCCANQRCQHEFPIIDGVPIILPGLRQYVSDNLLAIVRRSDLSATLEDMIGDCCGPGTPFDLLRQHLSSYGWSHYGQWDPQASGWTTEDSTSQLLKSALARSGPVSGPILDAGCSVGAGAFAAAESGQLVLGVDVNFSMLQLAQRVLRTGVVEYPLRRCGIVYERRRFEPPMENLAQVDFWACDAMALPFADATFATTFGFNTLDSITSPLALLENLRTALTTGGKLILACPYDWSVGVTPLEQWIGGHSNRGPQRGDSGRMLEDLLTPGGHPGSIDGLRLIHQSDDLHWRVRWHERGMIDYRVHLVVAERT